MIYGTNLEIKKGVTFKCNSSLFFSNLVVDSGFVMGPIAYSFYILPNVLFYNL